MKKPKITEGEWYGMMETKWISVDEIERIIGEYFIYCPYCGEEMQYKVSTDVSSGRCCKNITCGGLKF